MRYTVAKDTPNKEHLSIKDTWFCPILIQQYIRIREYFETNLLCLISRGITRSFKPTTTSTNT